MEIEVTNQQSKIAVALKQKAVDMDKMMKVMGEGYCKLWRYVAGQGKEVAGAPYCRYTNANEDYTQFDIELGVPVNEEIPDSGEFFMSQTYEGKALAGTHKGPYSTLETAYCAIMDYAKENSIALTANDCYDYYLNNPGETPEDELLTQVVFPINLGLYHSSSKQG
ncbi:MAG: GyrI-like domain-containing protein [Oscillospiraceae bacterium]|nr:GyrI-like domain-containing protein [Oscillospiraceae bacterium]